MRERKSYVLPGERTVLHTTTLVIRKWNEEGAKTVQVLLVSSDEWHWEEKLAMESMPRSASGKKSVWLSSPSRDLFRTFHPHSLSPSFPTVKMHWANRQDEGIKRESEQEKERKQEREKAMAKESRKRGGGEWEMWKDWSWSSSGHDLSICLREWNHFTPWKLPFFFPKNSLSF